MAHSYKKGQLKEDDYRKQKPKAKVTAAKKKPTDTTEDKVKGKVRAKNTKAKTSSEPLKNTPKPILDSLLELFTPHEPDTEEDEEEEFISVRPAAKRFRPADEDILQVRRKPMPSYLEDHNVPFHSYEEPRSQPLYSPERKLSLTSTPPKLRTLYSISASDIFQNLPSHSLPIHQTPMIFVHSVEGDSALIGIFLFSHPYYGEVGWSMSYPPSLQVNSRAEVLNTQVTNIITTMLVANQNNLDTAQQFNELGDQFESFEYEIDPHRVVPCAPDNISADLLKACRALGGMMFFARYYPNGIPSRSPEIPKQSFYSVDM